MRVLGARHVVALAARVRHHHADEADRDHRLVDQLHCREQAVDVVGAFHQHALLAAALAAGLEEALGLLERVVEIAHVGREQLVAGQGGAVLHRHHGQQVGRVRVFHALDHQRREAAAQVQQLAHLLVVLALGGVHRHRVRGLLRHHHEQRRVDDVRALAQDLALRALLAAAREEAAHVEEVVHRGVVGQRLARGQVDAVTREHVADLALRDRHHRADVHAVLQRREEVEAAATQLGLEAGLAVQREQAQLHRAAAAPQLLDHPDAVVGDVAHRARQGREQPQQQQRRERQAQCGQGGRSGGPATVKEIREHDDLPRVLSLVGVVSGRAQAATARTRLVAEASHEEARNGSARHEAGATRTARDHEAACRNVQQGSGSGAVRPAPARRAGVGSPEGRCDRAANKPLRRTRQRRRCRPQPGSGHRGRQARRARRRWSEKYASWTHCQRPPRARRSESCAACCGASMGPRIAV